MEFNLKNGALTICLAGRIDSVSAPEFDSGISKIISENEHDEFIFDAEKLEYISSAGLRVILKVRKSEPTLRIINTSIEVYDIFQMTGFTELMEVEKAYRNMSVDGCKIIGEGAKGTVYRYNGDTIIKVYKNSDSLPDIKNERELARRAFVLGIPTAISYDIVKVGDKFGSVFELLDAKSYSEIIAQDEENRDKYITEYAQLLRKIHKTEVKAEDMPDIKPFIAGWVDFVRPYISQSDADKILKLINDVPDRLTMIHGDYHTNNVMLQNGETLLIDMDTLSYGHPVFELANVYITYVGFGETDPSNVENFLRIPFSISNYIWDKFIRVYLDTDDENVIADVERKSKLLSSVRGIRHIVKHQNPDSEEGKRAIAVYKADIEELLPQIDTLDF